MDEALRELINAIKDMSPAVWEAALVRVQVQAWLNFGLAGVFLLVSGGLVYCSYICHRRIDKNSNDNEGPVTGMMIFGILAIIAFIPIIGNLYYGLLYFFSPDWAAIQLILEQV
ncbi:MAG: hypothetical protein V4721_09685, partial [Bacteroidota bacterium]